MNLTRKIARIRAYFRSFFAYIDMQEPITELSKQELMEIISNFKGEVKKENSNNFELRKAFRRLSFVLILLAGVFGLLGPGLEYYDSYKEEKKTKNAIKNLNQVATTMYFTENSPEVAMDVIEKSLEIEERNANTLYLKAFIESMVTVEKIKNLDRPYNKKELFEAQNALASAEFILESNDISLFSKAYLIKAQTYFALGENGRALTEIEKAIKYDPGVLFYKIRKASILVESKNYDKALALLGLLEKENDTQEKKWIYLWQGLTYNELKKENPLKKEKYLKIIKHKYEKAIEIDNRFHLAKMNLGMAYFETGDFDNAKKLYNEVLKLRPDHKETYFLLGKLYGSKDKYEKSKLYFLKALEQDPDYFSANLWMGLVFYELKEYKEALQYYNKAIKLKPDSSDAYYRRAKTFQKLELYKEAIKDYQEVLDESKNTKLAYRTYINSAEISLLHNDMVNGFNYLQSAKSMKKYINDDYFIMEFKYYKMLNMKDKALASLDNAIKNSSKNKKKHMYEKAFYLNEIGNTSEALILIEEIKLTKINKIGLLEKVLKLQYIIYHTKGNKKLTDKIRLEIKKFDPDFQ